MVSLKTNLKTMLSKKVLLKASFDWHRKLVWFGGGILFLYALSGFLHPLLVWTGPERAAFFPPKMSFTSTDVKSIQQVLAQHKINDAKLVKLVPSNAGGLLQVTEDVTQPRRYFDPKSLLEVENQDEQQAIWLARYYSGDQQSGISNVEFITEFNDTYNWVNRLLPVYKVEFDRDDGLATYVYTETNSLAAIDDNWKRFGKLLFRILHSWSWLDEGTFARWILMGAGLLAVFTTVITGGYLAFKIRRTKFNSSSRKYHYRMAKLFILPICLFVISGIYHMMQGELAGKHDGMRIDQTLVVSDNSLSTDFSWLNDYTDKKLLAISLVKANHDLFYRLSFPADNGGAKVNREQRFKGQRQEIKSVYVDAKTGQQGQLNDFAYAQVLATQLFNEQGFELSHSSIVTHFGMGYDFRNKRLPVWKATSEDSGSPLLFIDTTTGILVDQTRPSEKIEGWSFSFLHKWNFLMPLIGREARDIATALMMISVVVLAGFGLRMRLKRRA